MAKKEKDSVPFWALTGHKKPVTRRDFLSAGLIPFAGALLLPQWVNILTASNAYGESLTTPNCNNAATDLPAVMILNLSGGAGLSGNYVPLKIDGQSMLASYTKLGLGTSPATEAIFGNNAKFYTGSGFLAGFKNGITDVAVRQKTAFAALCAKSQDDTSANMMGIDGLVTKAGLIGSTLAQLDRSEGGSRPAAAVVNPPAPLIVSKLADIKNSLGYAGAMNGKLNVKQKQKLAALIRGLSESQARRLMANSSGDQIKNVIECAGLKNEDLNSGTPAGIELTDGALRAVWGNPAAGSQTDIFANMTYNVLNGNAGCGTISLGGYDYHDNTFTTGDTRDTDAALLVGRMIQMASAMNKKLFVYVTSDGSVVSTENTSARAGGGWVSDRGDAGCNYVLAFNPAGTAHDSKTQVGGFTDGQSADATSVIGNSPEIAAVAAFANYMSFAGKSSLFEDLAPGRLTAAQFDSVTRFK